MNLIDRFTIGYQLNKDKKKENITHILISIGGIIMFILIIRFFLVTARNPEKTWN